MKAAIDEFLNVIVIIGAILFVVFFAYSSIVTETQKTSGAEIIRISNEVMDSTLVNIFNSKPPGIDRTLAEILVDSTIEEKNLVDYGPGLGFVDVGMTLSESMNKSYGKLWKITVSVADGNKIKKMSYGINPISNNYRYSSFYVPSYKTGDRGHVEIFTW